MTISAAPLPDLVVLTTPPVATPRSIAGDQVIDLDEEPAVSLVAQLPALLRERYL